MTEKEREIDSFNLKFGIVGWTIVVIAMTISIIEIVTGVR